MTIYMGIFFEGKTISVENSYSKRHQQTQH